MTTWGVTRLETRPTMATTTDVTPANFIKWANAVVYKRCGITDDHDDLVNEMLIAMWRAEETHDPEKGSKTAWLIKAAEMRLGAMLSRGKPFGHVSSRQKPVDEIHFDRLAPAVQEKYEPRTFDPAEGAMLAYHRGEIALAISLLSEAQRRATGKVMQDDQLTGADRAAFSVAKPKLRASLAHLESE